MDKKGVIMKKNLFLSVVSILVITMFYVPLVYSGGGGTPSPPPPPPPPCQQQVQGCYTNEEFRSNAGSLYEGNFGYYLGQNACIAGGCTCSSSQFVDDIKQVDPDQTQGACSCIEGSQFDTRGGCCGDDNLDCGIISSGSLCNVGANFRESSWESVVDKKGDIVYLGCRNTEYLSDGNDWIECADQQFLKNVNNHDYLCIGVQEACIDQTWKPKTSEIRFGAIFTQTSNCQRKRTTIGTKCVPGLVTGTANVAFDGECPTCSDATGEAKCTPTENSLCGAIMELECPAGTIQEVVSTSSSSEFVSCVLQCDGSSTPEPEPQSSNISLFESGKGSIVECCASGFCNSRTDGERFSVGQSLQSKSSTYYCASDNTFAVDLDTRDAESCNNAKTITGEDAGFAWTGSLCCSEEDDDEESYNDPSGLGGCWDKKPVLNAELVPGTDNIANFAGKFFGCNVQDQEILNKRDTYTNEPMVENRPTCSQDPGNFFFCSVNNKWELANRQDRSHLSEARNEFGNIPQQTECCAADSCWNGQECTPNQVNKPNSQPTEGFRCVNGNWTDSALKFNPQGEQGGFCPEQEQCLVNPLGNVNDNNNPVGNPVCITDKQFVQDDYCEQGAWTTRTKFPAIQLLEIAGEGDYELFCDTPEKSLNNLDTIIQGQLAEDLVSKENTNNFCILDKDGQTFLGTTFNKPIDEVRPFLKLLDIDNCDSAQIDDGQYHPCDSGERAWYNQNLNSLIYSKQPFQIGEISFFDKFISFIKNPFDTLKNRIKGNIDEPIDESYERINRFDKLYMIKSGDKNIFGSIEGFQTKNLIIEYENFETDICQFIEEFNRKNNDDLSGIKCIKEGNTFSVLAQGSSFTNFNPGQVWTDLTSNLRP
ncbi:hypothetical protein ISS07_01360 [Candidatus Woesearchaeota archaeon]|nr:hypothetical protein [Candidatus Woesearchaeota archaeon]